MAARATAPAGTRASPLGCRAACFLAASAAHPARRPRRRRTVAQSQRRLHWRPGPLGRLVRGRRTALLALVTGAEQRAAVEGSSPRPSSIEDDSSSVEERLADRPGRARRARPLDGRDLGAGHCRCAPRRPTTRRAARRALLTISEVSRSSMEELRQMLALLRDDSAPQRTDGVSYEPAHGLADLETPWPGPIVSAGLPGPDADRRASLAAQRLGGSVRVPDHPGGSDQHPQARRPHRPRRWNLEYRDRRSPGRDHRRRSAPRRCRRRRSRIGRDAGTRHPARWTPPRPDPSPPEASRSTPPSRTRRAQHDRGRPPSGLRWPRTRPWSAVVSCLCWGAVPTRRSPSSGRPGPAWPRFKLARRARPDVMLMDIRMPHLDGVFGHGPTDG